MKNKKEEGCFLTDSGVCPFDPFNPFGVAGWAKLMVDLIPFLSNAQSLFSESLERDAGLRATEKEKLQKKFKEACNRMQKDLRSIQQEMGNYGGDRTR